MIGCSSGNDWPRRIILDLGTAGSKITFKIKSFNLIEECSQATIIEEQTPRDRDKNEITPGTTNNRLLQYETVISPKGKSLSCKGRLKGNDKPVESSSGF